MTDRARWQRVSDSIERALSCADGLYELASKKNRKLAVALGHDLNNALGNIRHLAGTKPYRRRK